MTVARNPLIRGFTPDPSLVRSGEWYYVATSSFEWFPTIPTNRSKDLAHWEYAGHVRGAVPGGSLAGAPDSGGIWAPSLSWDGARFWVVYTIADDYGSKLRFTGAFAGIHAQDLVAAEFTADFGGFRLVCEEE